MKAVSPISLLSLQGLNAIDAAVHKGLTHVVFNGSENIKKITGKDCGHLDSKAAIEEYLREVGEYTEIGNITKTCPCNIQRFFKLKKLKICSRIC